MASGTGMPPSQRRPTSVKKTQILRIRVDVNTHAALTRYCETHGQTLSSTLRRFLIRGVRKGGEDPASVTSLEQAKAWRDGATRRFCAETIASLLVAPVAPPPDSSRSDTAWRSEPWMEHRPDKREHVAQLIDELFRILSESDDWPAVPANDDEDAAPNHEDGSAPDTRLR
jgi:hypothetical protein